jgi:hypothetical protein
MAISTASFSGLLLASTIQICRRPGGLWTMRRPGCRDCHAGWMDAVRGADHHNGQGLLPPGAVPGWLHAAPCPKGKVNARIAHASEGAIRWQPTRQNDPGTAADDG